MTADSPWFVVHQRDGDLFVEAFTGEGAKHAARMTARDYAAQWSEVYLMRGQEVRGGDFEAAAMKERRQETHLPSTTVLHAMGKENARQKALKIARDHGAQVVFRYVRAKGIPRRLCRVFKAAGLKRVFCRVDEHGNFDVRVPAQWWWI